MNWLNYHHLQYFWQVAKSGSITAACKAMNVTQPTISAQLRNLEQQVGGQLYERQGRRIVLTELGQTVFRYADEIFGIGQELMNVVNGRTNTGTATLTIGVPDVMPKLITFRLLRPIFERGEDFHVVVREGSLKYLLSLLATHELDVVFSDVPAGAFVSVKAFNHPLGESPISIFGPKNLVRKFSKSMPESLANLPLLVPCVGTTLRATVDQWLESLDVPVNIIGEFDDTALMKVFAEAGLGFVPAPLVIEDDLASKFRLYPLCEIPNASEAFYAISIERRLRHPAIAAISNLARERLFGDVAT